MTQGNLDFLRKFQRAPDDLYEIFELYSFDNFFRLLLKDGLTHEDALFFMLAHCNFSALVFQERIHNRRYRKLSSKDAIEPELALHKMDLIHHILKVRRRG